MAMRGQAHKYGANVDTDAIIPARYLNVSDAATLARHCMEDIDPEFVKRAKPGDIVVAGPNFGSGSSREHAPVAIKASGVSCVIAESFARIFYRNAINIGLPILECPEAARDTRAGDTLDVELETGKIKNVSRGRTYQAQPFPAFMMELIAAGGLVAYTRRRLEAKGAV
ncbi:MAG: 3-isopropylmalate dehydratase small subunit [Chloroflexi bacterium]|nr:3-isopropylmalate dehydratase small subunit [Chloroflexota bacterium]